MTETGTAPRWSSQQETALREVSRWLRERDRPVFRLFGFAGSGKSTLARHLAEDAGRTMFAAYTGKAATVLRRMGCQGARTIHGLIYRVREVSPAVVLELEARYEELRRAEPRDLVAVVAAERELAEARAAVGKPRFELNPDSVLRGADLLVVDEVSMVDARVGEDLLSFGVPVLVLGDPAQLPPVRGSGFFTKAEPDVMLTEIHRQARDDPIVRMATEIRSRKLPEYGDYGERTRVVPPGEFDAERDLTNGTQLIVGRNATRRRANARRRERLGYEDPLPLEGERLVCLRNNHDVGLMNGAVWNVVERGEDLGDTLSMVVEEDGEDGNRLAVVAHAAPFRNEEVPWWGRRDAEEFDYAYALTCHKSQGSQWDSVVVVDESQCFRDDRWRWLYTAVTRAAERLVLVRR